MKDSDLLKFSADLGEIMLSAGAETLRVEDTLERILSVGAERYPETFVTTTGIFICIKNYQGDPFTMVRRIKNRGTNLEKLIAANALSRDFTSGKVNLKEAVVRLEEIKNIKSFSPLLVIISDGLVSGGFSIMLGSGIIDGICAAVVGMLLGIFIYFYSKSHSEVLFEGFIGGAIISVLAVFAVRSGIGTYVDGIIIGAAMPLVPGVAITNIMRDIIAGDVITGTTKLAEVLLIALAIAVGIALAMSSVLMFGGGL